MALEVQDLCLDMVVPFVANLPDQEDVAVGRRSSRERLKASYTRRTDIVDTRTFNLTPDGDYIQGINRIDPVSNWVHIDKISNTNIQNPPPLKRVLDEPYNSYDTLTTD